MFDFPSGLVEIFQFRLGPNSGDGGCFAADQAWYPSSSESTRRFTIARLGLVIEIMYCIYIYIYILKSIDTTHIQYIYIVQTSRIYVKYIGKRANWAKQKVVCADFCLCHTWNKQGNGTSMNRSIFDKHPPGTAANRSSASPTGGATYLLNSGEMGMKMEVTFQTAISMTGKWWSWDFGGFPVHRSYQERITYIAPRIQCFFFFQPVAMLLTFAVAQVASHGAAGSLGKKW